jgi:hypothetical protein
MRGHVHAEGLGEKDVLEVVGLTADGTSCYLGQLDCNTLAVIFDPKVVSLVRAFKIQSGGNPVTVWVV